MDEPILEHLRRRLSQHERLLAQCSRDTGIDYSTVYRICTGRNENPGIVKVQKILDWCDARDAMLERIAPKEAAA